MSAPAARGLLGTVTGREDQDPGGLAGAVRQVHGAADHLVGLARVDTQAHGDLDGARRTWWWWSPWPAGRPRAGRTASSAVDLRGGSAVGLAALHVCSCGWCRSWSRGRGPRLALPRGAACGTGADSALDRDAHRTGGAGDDLLAASRSLAFRSGILVSAISRTWALVSLATLVLCGSPEPFSTPRGLEDQPGGRRGLGDEGEGAVLVDRDLHRHDLAALRLGRGVVGLAELHDVDAVLAQRGADRRRRVGRAGLDLELDEPCEPSSWEACRVLLWCCWR